MTADRVSAGRGETAEADALTRRFLAMAGYETLRASEVKDYARVVERLLVILQDTEDQRDEMRRAWQEAAAEAGRVRQCAQDDPRSPYRVTPSDGCRTCHRPWTECVC